MKNKLFTLKVLLGFLLGLSLLSLTLVTLLKNNAFVYLHAIIIIISLMFEIYVLIFLQRYIYNYLNQFIDTLDPGQKNILNNFPLPVIMIKNSGEIIWYNGIFRKNVLKSIDMFGCNISDVIADFKAEMLTQKLKIETSYQSKTYDVYVSLSKNKIDDNGNVYVLYFIDTTSISNLKKECILNKPIVSIITIDNYDDFVSQSSSNERSMILNDIEVAIDNVFGKNHGVLRKIEKDKFVSIQESKYISEIMLSKFSVLEHVRSVSEKSKIPVTLSIGIGFDGSTINESEIFAKQALDMALGRGGDQVVIKRNGEFEFFGGVFSGIEKRTKVKTRVVASALAEIIENSDNVIIMGHKYADLDCLGAAIGMAKGIYILDNQKEVNIAINQEKNLAKLLLEKIKNNYDYNIFIDSQEAVEYISKKTLLIIVDTHLKHFLEFEDIYKSCKNIVVIDHHRKTVGHIDNAIIFYHEPAASSTSEMVTELLQYFNDKNSISNIEAESLLAGIMLDTRNFVLKTGVRTFEAAAYLKKQGADMVAVKKLFSNSMDSYQKKTRLISSAEIYKRCAISMAETSNEDLRIIAAQAADEILNITDIDASFVFYKFNDDVIISARSMGVINVQVIMEYLGGGGHLTMAGTQLKDISLDDAKQKLLNAIDKYKNSL